MSSSEYEAVRFDLGDRSYDVLIGSGLLTGAAGEIAARLGARTKAFIITDENVGARHLATIAEPMAADDRHPAHPGRPRGARGARPHPRADGRRGSVIPHQSVTLERRGLRAAVPQLHPGRAGRVEPHATTTTHREEPMSELPRLDMYIDGASVPLAQAAN